MSKWGIVSYSGMRPDVMGCPTYHGVYRGVSYLEFKSIESPYPLNFGVGDYVDYTRGINLRFRLYDIPIPKKQARKNEYGAAFVYENVQLFAATKDLELTPFFDYVISDNTKHYSSRKDATTYENVSGVMSRLQECMEQMHPGEWHFVFSDPGDVDASEARDFTISGSVLDGLNAIGDVWKGLGWIHTYGSVDGTNKNIITIGGANSRTSDNTTPLFQYGRGRGLKVIAGSVTNKNEIVTRIYPFGSERNIRPAYYRGKDIKDAPGVDIPNLMLPIDHWGTTLVEGEPLPDPKKAYIDDATGIAKYGIRPKKVYFDGTGDEKEIYPSISEVTISNVRDADPPIMPDGDVWDDDDRVDEVFSVENPTDQGYIGDGDNKYIDINTVTPSAASGSIYLVDKNVREDGQYDSHFIVYTTNFYSTGNVGLQGYAELIDDGVITFEYQSEYAIFDLWLKVTGRRYGSVSLDKTSEYHLTVSPSSFNPSTMASTYVVDLKSLLVSDCYTDIVFVSIVNATINNGTVTTPTTLDINITSNARIGWYQKPVSSFKMRIPQVGFDPNEQAATGSGMTIAMKDGTCAGREFVVNKCVYVSGEDSWELTLTRAQDDSTGYLYPNANGYDIAAGDHFVILDISMPELYINIAANRLEAAATERLGELSSETMQYTPEVDSKVIAENGWTLREGMWMAVYDPDLSLSPNGGESDLFSSDPSDLFSDNDEDLQADDSTTYVLIDSITIDEGAASVPIYNVTLSDKKRDSLVSYIKKSVNTIGKNAALIKSAVTIMQRNLRGLN